MKKILLALTLIFGALAPATISAQERTYESEKLVGKKAPDFTLTDTAGKQVSLSSLKGKWVVLDFWGSWCGWCIKGFPQMKENYAKLGKKVAFVGVDCGDTQEKWLAAVEKHQLPWINLRQPEEGANLPTNTYRIQGFPTKFIINPEGYIVNCTIGEDPEFYNVLEALVK